MISIMEGFPEFPEIKNLDRKVVLYYIQRLGHLIADQMHYEPEQRGAEAMLSEALMEGQNQMTDDHSDLYHLWHDRVADL